MASVARLRVSLLAAGLALLWLPGVVAAHGAGVSRFEAPIPLPLLFAGAGATVALTALWLGVRPSLGDRRINRSRSIDLPAIAVTALRHTLGIGFLGLVGVSLVVGATGRQVAAENPATVLVWAVWIHGLAILAVLVGNPWPSLSPWRIVYRGLRWLEGERLAIGGTYPAQLGTWPALVGFIVLVGVVENLTVVPRSPRLTVLLVAGYAFAMVAGAVLWGEPWMRRADPLGMFYRLLSRVAPFRFETDPTGRSVTVRLCAPWRATNAPLPGLPAVAIVVAAVYTVSFDGVTETVAFQGLLFDVRGALGTDSGTTVLLYFAGLAGFLGLFGLVAHLAEGLGTDSEGNWRQATIQLAPTLLPIVAAYEIAHVYPYVMSNLGRLPSLFISAVAPIEPLSWLSVPAFWSSQIVLIIAGHVVAVVAAHTVCTDRYETQRDARRAHFPLVVLMVAFTVLSLWIVSQPLVTG